MSLTRQIFNYCERGADGAFWAEPANALTNASFIVAALVTLAMAMRRGRLDGAVGWLIGVCFVVGIGSFLFHTFATVWAVMADSGPIMIFILSYFAIAMRYFGGYGWVKSLLLMLGFVVGMVALSAALRPFHATFNGSQSYFPAFVALMAVGIWLKTRHHAAGRWLIGVAAIFALSLTFRSIDQTVCARWALGTHWLWHVLNGVVLGTLITALIRHGDRPVDGGRSAG